MLISSVRRRKKLFQPSLVRIIVTYLPVNSLSATYKISSLKYSFIILSDIIHILTTFKNYFYIPIINYDITATHLIFVIYCVCQKGNEL